MKNTQWSISLQEAQEGIENVIEFQLQIKGHKQQEYVEKWPDWQNRTD